MAVSNQKQGVGSFQVDESEFLASSLDIFKPPNVESDIVSGKEILIRPVNSLTDDGPYEFHIISADKEYLQMPMTRLITDIKIVKIVNWEEKDAAPEDDYSVINLVGKLNTKMLSFCSSYKVLWSIWIFILLNVTFAFSTLFSGNSIYRQLEVYLNDCQLMDLSSSLYGYKSVIETYLSYGQDAKSTHLITSGYYDDGGKETTNEERTTK